MTDSGLEDRREASLSGLYGKPLNRGERPSSRDFLSHLGAVGRGHSFAALCWEAPHLLCSGCLSEGNTVAGPL